MNIPRSIKSFWWSPDHPEIRWFGTLTLELDKTPSLELFIERTAQSQPLPTFGTVIHGKDEHGKPITLLFTGSDGNTISGAVIRLTIIAGYALIGIRLPNAESFIAHSLCFQLQHLYGWLGRSGYADTRETAGTFIVQFRHPEDEIFVITPELDLVIQSTYKSHNDFQERSMKEDAALTFKSKSGLSLAGCRKIVGSMQMLLHFAILETVYPTWMTAYQNGHGYEALGRWISHDIELVGGDLHEAKSEHPLPERWIFRFEDIRQNFAEFIRDWLEYEKMYSEALNCYASTIYHNFPWEMTLLALTQALDAYHGIKYDSHKNRDLKEKLQTLVKDHAESLKGLVDNPTDFADQVHASRNYYTHHNPKLDKEGKVARDADLFRMNERLKLLFQMCVLSDLKIPKDRFVRLRSQIATDIVVYWDTRVFQNKKQGGTQ
jgi:hypothetical protein